MDFSIFTFVKCMNNYFVSKQKTMEQQREINCVYVEYEWTQKVSFVDWMYKFSIGHYHSLNLHRRPFNICGLMCARRKRIFISFEHNGFSAICRFRTQKCWKRLKIWVRGDRNMCRLIRIHNVPRKQLVAVIPNTIYQLTFRWRPSFITVLSNFWVTFSHMWIRY